MHADMTVERPETDASARSWLCESAADRERMLDMESRLRPVRAVTMAALALGLLLSGPWIGFWTLAPLAGAAAAFVMAERLGKRIRYPEYAMMAAWIMSQAAIAAGVALTGGPDSPALVLMLTGARHRGGGSHRADRPSAVHDPRGDGGGVDRGPLHGVDAI